MYQFVVHLRDLCPSSTFPLVEMRPFCMPHACMSVRVYLFLSLSIYQPFLHILIYLTEQFLVIWTLYLNSITNHTWLERCVEFGSRVGAKSNWIFFEAPVDHLTAGRNIPKNSESNSHLAPYNFSLSLNSYDGLEPSKQASSWFSSVQVHVDLDFIVRDVCLTRGSHQPWIIENLKWFLQTFQK